MQILSSMILPFALKTNSSVNAVPDGPPIVAVDLIVLAAIITNYYNYTYV